MRHTVGDLDIEEVKKRIERSGMRMPVSDSTLRLSCTPLHLSVVGRCVWATPKPVTFDLAQPSPAAW